MNKVDDILADFEPAFRRKLERKVFESTIDQFNSVLMRTMGFVGIFFYSNLSYVVLYNATHGGGWLSWMFGVLFGLAAVVVPFVAWGCFGANDARTKRKLAEEAKWSIDELERMTKEFPDRPKKEFLRLLRLNLTSAAKFMS